MSVATTKSGLKLCFFGETVGCGDEISFFIDIIYLYHIARKMRWEEKSPSEKEGLFIYLFSFLSAAFALGIRFGLIGSRKSWRKRWAAEKGING